jgi:hypothetical protein
VMRHRVREQLVGQRTALLNALRGHLRCPHPKRSQRLKNPLTRGTVQTCENSCAFSHEPVSFAFARS